MTYNEMLNNANVVGLPDGTWYESRQKAVRPYRVKAIGGLGADPASLLPNLFVLVAPVALGLIVLAVASAMKKSGA